jgi:hypothetical protein
VSVVPSRFKQDSDLFDHIVQTVPHNWAGYSLYAAKYQADYHYITHVGRHGRWDVGLCKLGGVLGIGASFWATGGTYPMYILVPSPRDCPCEGMNFGSSLVGLMGGVFPVV